MMMGRRVINRENKKIYQIIFKKIKVIGNRIEYNNFTTGHRMTNAIFPTIIIRPKANTNQIIPPKIYIKIINTTYQFCVVAIPLYLSIKKEKPSKRRCSKQKSVKRTE